MSSPAGDHPELLMWYACGRLDAAEIEPIERHLALCEDCRADLLRLRSMGASLRREAASRHPACAALVAYHDGDPALQGSDAARIAEHLTACGSCRSDFARLTHASARGRRRFEIIPTAAAATPPVTRGARGLLAAAAMVLVILSTPVRPFVSTAAFTPALRGPEATRRLVGLGPWRFSVLLPTQAIEADYAIRLRSVDGGEASLFAATGRFSPKAPAMIDVPSFSKPGRYVLVMEAAGEGEAGAHTYPFEVVVAP